MVAKLVAMPIDSGVISWDQWTHTARKCLKNGPSGQSGCPLREFVIGPVRAPIRFCEHYGETRRQCLDARPAPAIGRHGSGAGSNPSISSKDLSASHEEGGQGAAAHETRSAGCEGRGRRHTTTATILRQQASPCKTPGRMRPVLLGQRLLAHTENTTA